MSRVLAVDLGASSGRVMAGTFEDGRITYEELHQFPNDPVLVRGTLYWDILRLFFEIKRGISKAVNTGGFDSIGIDTWGVDFGLLRPDGRLVGNPVHYRDARTDDYELCPVTPREAYEATGMEIIYFNTIYQLNSIARKEPHVLSDAATLLFTPDLLNYMLCGSKYSEYTIASTSEMLNARTRTWDTNLIQKAGIPKRLLCEIVMPGTICGLLSTEITEELGAPAAEVMCIASHDTASAVAAVPTQEEDFVFISCGTWSLMGTVLDQPLINETAFKHNFTNEGTVGGKIQFLKNIMGTWLIQESKRQWSREGQEYTFGDLEALARECEPFQCFIDVDDGLFSKPGNLPGRIQQYCKDTKQPVPLTPGEIVRCIDESLAMKFRYTLECLRDCTGGSYSAIHLMGGGANSALLCQMTASAANVRVIAGPREATVYGNVGVQLIGRREVADVRELRQAVADSCNLVSYEPEKAAAWDKAYEMYRALVHGGEK